MDSKRQKIFALTVAVIVIAATFAAFMTARDREEQPAEPETLCSWNLTALFADDDAYYAEVERLNREVLPVLSEKAAAVGTADGAWEYLVLDDEVRRAYGELRSYVWLPYYLDMTCDRSAYAGAAKTVGNGISLARAQAETILGASSAAYQQQLLADERLTAWEPYLIDLFAGKTTVDPQVAESIKLLNALDSDYYDAYYRLFYVDLSYPTVTAADGTTVVANYDGYSSASESDDRDFRKAVRDAYYGSFARYSDTAASLLDGHVRCTQNLAELKGYDTVLERTLNGTGVSTAAFDRILTTVESAAPSIERYHNLLGEHNGYETSPWDGYDTISAAPQDYYTVAEAKALILAALAPLGEDYLEVVEKIFDEGWIDLMPHEHRFSSWWAICYDGGHPWISGYWDGTYYCVTTLAHEIGHAVNYYCIDTANCCLCNDLADITSEVPSLLNELLLASYMEQQAGSEAERGFFLEQEMSLISGNCCVIAGRLSFEESIHQLSEDGRQLTASVLNKAFLATLYQFQPGTAWEADLSASGWIYIINFFDSSYDQAHYLVDIMIALELRDRLLAGEGLSDYLEFLAAGSAFDGSERFAMLGVDPEDPEFGQSTVTRLDELVDGMEQIYG